MNAAPTISLPVARATAPATGAPQSRYMVQLDELRAFAVLAVMFGHF